jgi:formate dehydrogenase
MIESIEGKRGMPRLRPPYVAQVGLFGRPTLVTTSRRCTGCARSSRRAPPGSPPRPQRPRKGLRSFSVSGRVREARRQAGAGRHHGARADRRVLRRHGRRPRFYAYLPGGASGGILPASMADMPLDFDTLQPHGCFIGSAAVVVLSHQDDA